MTKKQFWLIGAWSLIALSACSSKPKDGQMCIRDRRNPYLQLLTGHAEDSGETAVVRCEEGGDDEMCIRDGY